MKMKLTVKRVLALMLTLVLIITGINVPGVRTRAAEVTEIDLSQYITMSGTTAGNSADGGSSAERIMINLPDDMDEKAEWEALGIKSLVIEFTVSEFTTTNQYPGGMLFFMAQGSSKWNQGTWADLNLTGALTSTMIIDELDWGSGTRVGQLGLEVCNLSENTPITYNISSVKFVLGTSSEDTNDTEIPTGSQISSNGNSDEVKATITEIKDNDYWYEYNITVSNSSNNSICDWVIKAYLPGIDVSKLNPLDTCKLTYVDGYLYIEGIGDGSVVAAGSNNSAYSVKIGAGSSIGLDTLDITQITYEYGSESNNGVEDFEFNYTLTGQTKDLDFEDTPVGRHGKLHVDGIYLYDENNEKFQLRGASLHGLQWDVGQNYINKGAFQSLRDEWGINAIRLPVYVTQSGYTEGASATMDTYIQNAVNYATELGMYVLIDWHVHSASGETTNPNTWKSQANTFFDKYANMYKNHKNVLFEICNEPVNTPWHNGSGNDLYSYANSIIPTIRQYTDAVVIVGTNTWSQDVDEVANHKLSTTNTMYTIHFYSATHMSSIRSKVQNALNAGVPIFCTEFGVCSADGNGSYNLTEADAWMDLFDQYNISYFCWQLSNKNEKSSYLATSSNKATGGWVNSDLSTTGMWLINENRPKAEAEDEKYASTDTVAVTGVTLSTNDLKIDVGETSKLTAAVLPSNATNKNVIWEAESTSVATVDSSGNVKGIKPGSTTITVTTEDGEKTATCTVEVYGPYDTPAPPTLGAYGPYSINLVSKSGYLYRIEGGEWTSSYEFKNLKPNTEYTFYQKQAASGYYYESASSEGATFKTQPVNASSVVLDKTELEFEIGGANEVTTATLNATVSPSDASYKTVTWTTSNDKVAAVDSTGKVTAVGPGEATITAKINEGANKPSATCTVTVWKTPDVPTQTPSTSTTPTKDTITLTPYEGCEYRIAPDGQWQDSNIFTGLEPGTEYTFEIRVKGDEDNNVHPGEVATIKVSTGNTGGTTGGDTGNSGGTAGGNTGNDGNDAGTAIPFVAPDIKVSYRTHIQTFGWEGKADDIKTWKANGAMSGTSGLAKRLEGINIVVAPTTTCEDLDLGIQYTTHCQSYGWLPWSADGDMNGTEGEAKRLEAIMIQLTGEHADYYDVYYRVHAQTYGWLGWAKNGEPSGTAGYAKRLEGIQIVVVKKGESYNQKMEGITSARTEAFVAKAGSSPIVNYPATSNTNPVVPGADDVNVAYRTHVQSFGWQGWKYNGQMSGTSGLAKRLEGIEINLTNKDYDGGIAYATHVQTYGWQGADLNKPSTWKHDGQMAGTSGEAKRLEAICITLTGDMAEHYDIYYRVHAQSYGWLGWAKNGETSGTAGYAKRLEGIQIVIVPKGGKAPTNHGGIISNDTRAYIEK